PDGADVDAADAEQLYRVLEEEVVPLFYERDARGVPLGWVDKMKHALRVAGGHFTARRMVQQYVTDYYVPAIQGQLAGDDPPAAGMPTTVVLPLYRQVRATAPSLERAGPPFTVTLGDRTETAWLYRVQDSSGPQVFFIEHPDFFDRAGIYGDDAGDYPDNALRFAFFCAAALTVLPQVAPEAQVLHAHDWHTGLAPAY